jgi:pantoate--beta-alanine ligase
MGALHEGHLSLVRRCASECDETIVTIFVNPLQFGQNEDLDRYPRDEENDLRLATDAGATVAYCPTVSAMYAEDRSIFIDEDVMSGVLCGASRPTHFRGVLTVVAKLFNACVPDRAYFGEKDFQQLQLIRRMVRDLDFPVEIVPCPTVREPDGLAISSRNRYLSPSERKDALCLYFGIVAAHEEFLTGNDDPRAIELTARGVIESVKSARIDYVECRDAESLAEIDRIEHKVVLAEAVFIGATRLIDNTVLTPEEEK